MGNKNSIEDSKDPDPEEESPARIVINDRVTLREKTRTRFVLVIAMCCSTVINTVEPEPGSEEIRNIEEDERQRPALSSLAITQQIVPPPKKPLTSRPRIRRFGYKFTAKVDPLILSADDLEEISKFGQEIVKEQDESIQTEIEAAVGKIISAEKKDEDKEQAELEKSEKDLERIRARSAVINTVSANEIQRRKMNEVRLLQAKMKREEEKRRLKQNMKSFKPMAPIKEDTEGEEIVEKSGDITPRPSSGILRSRRASVAPMAVRNRMQQRLARKDLYFKAIQELLEIGDAYRVVKEAMMTIDECSDDESSDDDSCDNFPFEHRLKQRKMSLSGVLEQSAAERTGFAALLSHKLNLLLIEDEIEGDASCVGPELSNLRRYSSESAPPSLFYIKETQSSFDKSTESGEESLTIFNESDSNPWNGRGYISQLTTPRATPYLSPITLSPRSSVWSCDPGSGLPWLSQSAGPGVTRHRQSSSDRASAPPDILTRVESAVSDRPLYKSYFMGLDKVGLDNEATDIYDWDNGWDSESDDVFSVPDRSQSAPSPVREWKKRRSRPKTCSPLLGR